MRGAQSLGELGQVTWPGGSWSCDHGSLSHHPLLLSSLATLALELLGTAAVPGHLRASPQVSRLAVTPSSRLFWVDAGPPTPHPSLFRLALAYPASLFDVHVWTY